MKEFLLNLSLLLLSISISKEVFLQNDPTIYNIYYYVNGTKVELQPSKYVSEKGSSLPTFQMKGFHFIGWFPSSISMYRYDRIPQFHTGDLTLYARFYSINNDTKMILPEATARVGLMKDSSGLTVCYDIEGKWPSPSTTDYNWNSSDPSVATLSTYSTVTPKKDGFAIITGELKSDPSKIVNAILCIDGDEIRTATEEEANKLILLNVTFKGLNDEVMEIQTMKKGEEPFYPNPSTYKDYYFNGWDKLITQTKENVTITAKYSQTVNKFQNKTIGILGDSISTFDGYIPSGYAPFYPVSYGDIRSILDTYWMKVVNTLGGSMFVNNAWGGSTVSDHGSSSTCRKERLITSLIQERGPEIILINMGANDAASTGVTENEFRNAYKQMLTYMNELFPKTDIYLITLFVSKLYTEERQIMVNGVIRECAEEFGKKLIDISDLDLRDYLVDRAHPKKAGMDLLSKAILEKILI